MVGSSQSYSGDFPFTVYFFCALGASKAVPLCSVVPVCSFLMLDHILEKQSDLNAQETKGKIEKGKK